MILARDRVAVRGLVAVPAVEIGIVAGEFAVDVVAQLRVDHKAEERQPVLLDECLELRNGEAVLLHVEAEIAAAAHVEEVRRLPYPADFRKVAGHEVFTEASDIVCAAPVAALLDQVADFDDVLPTERAVEPEIEEPAGSQELEQDAPAFEWIVEVMQHAARLDHVEGTRERAELEDVGLRVVDGLDRELVGLAFGIAETCETEIDR